MKSLLFFFSILCLIGCIEEFDLNTPDNEARLVVEGLITNKPGPYYIRLTKSNTGIFIAPDYQRTDKATPVMDAFITITDDTGLIDTLAPINVNINDYKYDPFVGYYKFLKDDQGIIIDTIYLQDPPEYRHDRGFYKTVHLKGLPGHSYELKVITEGKTFNAKAFMPSVPEVDSISYQIRKSEKDGQEYYIPLLYFQEPQNIKNYYLIQLVKEEDSRSTTASSLWQFSILTDKYLEPYVRGLNIDLGISPDGSEYPVFMSGDSIYVALSSITEGAYKYYESLLGQFKYDGGVYKQVPSSPPTNISNGGLGYFRASSVSEKKITIK